MCRIARCHSGLRLSVLFCLLVVLAGCSKHLKSGDVAYVSAPQVTLRDRVAAVYNKITIVKNGERVEVLDHHKLFDRIRTSEGLEGWVEKRTLVGKDVFDGFQALANAHGSQPVQAKANTRAELNMHVAPGRQTEALYQLAKNESVDVLQRGSVERPPPKNAPPPDTTAQPSGPHPPAMEDWWLVRDSQHHVGWVYGHLLDFDVPLEIAQYAENKRMVAFFVLNEALDDTGKRVPQYLTLLSEPKDGMPFDFNQARVFTWNTKRHRYETAYREHKLDGILPATVGTETFDKKEGPIPVFTLRLRDAAGHPFDRKYKMSGVIVRPIPGPGDVGRAR